MRPALRQTKNEVPEIESETNTWKSSMFKTDSQRDDTRLGWQNYRRKGKHTNHKRKNDSITLTYTFGETPILSEKEKPKDLLSFREWVYPESSWCKGHVVLICCVTILIEVTIKWNMVNETYYMVCDMFTYPSPTSYSLLVSPILTPSVSFVGLPPLPRSKISNHLSTNCL